MHIWKDGMFRSDSEGSGTDFSCIFLNSCSQRCRYINVVSLRRSSSDFCWHEVLESHNFNNISTMFLAPFWQRWLPLLAHRHFCRLRIPGASNRFIHWKAILKRGEQVSASGRSFDVSKWYLIWSIWYGLYTPNVGISMWYIGCNNILESIPSNL